MTFMVNKTDRVNFGEEIAIVRVTYGPITIEVEEGVSHLRSFWGDLGRVLGEVKHEKEAEEAIAEAIVSDELDDVSSE